MIENRIRSSNAINLDFEDIRSAVRDNMERAAERAAVTKKKLPYMRAIRAVCIALCVCMATGILTLVIKETSFWNAVIPPNPMPNETDIGAIPPMDRLTDPGKSPYHAEKYDSFFAFATFVNPNVLINSDLLKDEDRAEFYEYAKESKSYSYIIYMGITDQTDIITVIDWVGDKRFDFTSNLNYRYEDIISEFEKTSSTIITDEFLTGTSYLDSLTDGIYLKFEEDNGWYAPYYEANLNGEIYVINSQDKGFSGEPVHVDTRISGKPFEFAMGYGCTTPMDKSILESFDKFFAFGTLSPGPLYKSCDLLSEQDREKLKEAGQGFAYYDYYLGIKDGVDVVVVRIPYNNMLLTFNSNLDYRYEDIIKEFENISGTTLTGEFLETSNYDSNMQKEMGGISLCLYKQEGGETDDTYASYFKANINGKIYVVKQ